MDGFDLEIVAASNVGSVIPYVQEGVLGFYSIAILRIREEDSYLFFLHFQKVRLNQVNIWIMRFQN